MMPSRLAFWAVYTEVSMARAFLKLSSTKILSALLLTLSFGLAEPGHAETPVIGRLQGGRLHGRQNRSPFLRPRGTKGKISGPVSVPGLFTDTSPGPHNASPLAPAVEVAGFDGIDQNMAGVDPPDGAI